MYSFHKLGTAIAAAAIGFAASAVSAATLDGTYTVDYHQSGDGPGLYVDVAPSGGNIGPVELANVGDTTYVGLFKIWADETTVNPDDEIPVPITVNFDFSSPLGTPSVSGSTSGNVFFIFQSASLNWDNPYILDFADGTKLGVWLTEGTFSEGLFGLSDTPKKGLYVKAKFKLLAEATPVPLPASGMLLIAGLGGVAAMRRRKKAA